MEKVPRELLPVLSLNNVTVSAKYQLLKVLQAESVAAVTDQDLYQDPYPVATTTTSLTYTTAKEVLAEVIAEVIAYIIEDQTVLDTLEAETPSEVAENIDLGSQVENEHQSNTPATSSSTSADYQPFQTYHGRSFL